MLFVAAAVHREANFGNRLLKHISALKGTISQTLEVQAHPVLWVSLVANSSFHYRRVCQAQFLLRPHWSAPASGKMGGGHRLLTSFEAAGWALACELNIFPLPRGRKRPDSLGVRILKPAAIAAVCGASPGG